jgi:predicted enzyme related to lactoylglutathione lyase
MLTMVDRLRRTRAFLPRGAFWMLSLGALAGGVVLAAPSFELPPIGGSPAERHAGKIVWADLVTPDLTAAEHFYGGLFGWTFQQVHNGKTDYAVALIAGRPVGGLLQRPVPAGEHRQSAWLTFISVGDVDVARRTALSHGAKSVSEPKSYSGRGRQAVLSDPEGAVFAVLTSASGDPPDYLAEPGEWIWSALLTRNPGQSAGFYQALFGYDVFDAPGDDGAEHLVFSSDDYARASANTLPGGSARRHPHWLNFIRVTDAVQAADKAVSLGGRMLVEPHDDRHGGKSAVVADPAGAPIGLMEWSDSESKAEPK